ncbi:MAG: lactate permease LctP family transporter [Bryobacterales bacterium]|nr:lactate permease LctP family transporter [Bryobacterales bacterium]
MWSQHYTPAGENLALSAAAASVPVLVLLILLGVRRKPAWIAALWGLAAAAAVALVVYRMPPLLVVSSVCYGAAFGLFPIGWIVFWAIMLYRVTLETGQFEIIKDSIGGLTRDARLQALLVAFAFGAFLEGAAGFGTPVAVAAAMLAGLGFPSFYAAGICLLANTAPVAFGSIGIPVTTLALITGLPVNELSGAVGRLCAPVSLCLPGYLILVMKGRSAARAILPAAAVCGVSFAATQLLVSNCIGPELTDILSSLAAIASLLVLIRIWKPAQTEVIEPHKTAHHPPRVVLGAWMPYLMLIVFVLLWATPAVKATLNSYTIPIAWPGLHDAVLQMPPVTQTATVYHAIYRLDWLAAAGTACALATIVSALLLGVSPRRFVIIFLHTCRQLALSMVTIASVLALAFLTNYCGATATLGLAFSATGAAFPFFSGILGWLGVFLTGSDTAANALFGNLQVVTAGRLGLNPVLMAAANSAGGVMGKMISLQSIAVAAAATNMPSADEARLFRFTLRHSILLAAVIGVITTIYAYCWGR